MVDLDFSSPWPINEIVSSLKTKIPWDCIAANGLNKVVQNKTVQTVYWDRFAFRSKDYPIGPEIVGKIWWADLQKDWFSLPKKKWIPVYSAFGGLAIFKTKTVLKFSYSGSSTPDLAQYYKQILQSTPLENRQISKYHERLRTHGFIGNNNHPPTFELDCPCCEHLPLYAAMALQGHNKFFVNPKMKMYYYK